MSGVDQRIRRELQRLTRPVDAAPVMDRIADRKHRRRVVRRVQVAALALFVVTGTVAGGYGLIRLFGTGPSGDVPIDEPSESGSASVPPPSDTPSPTGVLCDVSSLVADVDGDGVPDEVTVFRPVSDTTCDPSAIGAQDTGLHQARIAFGGEGRVETEPQVLSECYAFACRVFAAPDIDGDGAAEVAIRHLFGASTEFFGLYRLDPDWNLGDPALELLEIAPPGDPWHEEFGSPPGPGLFAWGGSVTHLHSARCATESGISWIVVTALRPGTQEDVYDIHESQFLLEGNQLVLTASSDYPDTPFDEIDLVLGSGEEMCGASVVRF
jgi:hypothetical protein